MGADSALRRAAKQALAPILSTRAYQVIQAAAKAWDIRTGSWTEPELGILPVAIRPGETVLDIGANYGLYCYHLSRAVGPRGRVLAFEPVPFTATTCRLVGRLLGFTRNVEVITKGASDRTGRVLFTIPVQRSGAISAGQAHLAGRNDEREGKAIHAPHPSARELWCDVIALDEFLPDPGDLSFIKSDIEGADLLALRGAARLIERHRPTILCEMSSWFLEGFGIRPEGFGELLLDRGYRLYHYEARDGRRWLEPATLEQLGTFSTSNYLFVHPSRRDRFAELLDSPTPAGGGAEVRPTEALTG